MKYLKIILVILIALLLLFFFFKDVNFTEVGRVVKEINPFYPLIFLVGAFLQYFIRAYRWGIILKPHKKKIPLATLYNYTAIGFFLNLLPGRLGEPLRGLLLAREEGIKKSYGLASIVVERMMDFLMMILIFLLSLFFIEIDNSSLLLKLKNLSFYLLPLLILVFFLFYFLNSPRVFAFIEKVVNAMAKILPAKIRERSVEFTLSFLKGLKVNLPVFDFIKLIISSLVVWLFMIAFYFALMRGFNINISYFDAIPYFSIMVVFAAIPTPGMTGTIDLGSKLALTQLYNVHPDTAVAFTLLVHALLLVVWVVPGLVAISMQGLNIKTIKNITKQKQDEMP